MTTPFRANEVEHLFRNAAIHTGYDLQAKADVKPEETRVFSRTGGIVGRLTQPSFSVVMRDVAPTLRTKVLCAQTTVTRPILGSKQEAQMLLFAFTEGVKRYAEREGYSFIQLRTADSETENLIAEHAEELDLERTGTGVFSNYKL